MSFLSRKPARPDGRGRDDEYDDYDNYAPDGYQSEDDGWSPGEYFSPEGIKGRWAGEQPDGRAGGRGRHDNDRAEADAGYDSYGDDFSGAEYGGPGYADELANGAYELPDGADEDRQDRSRRRRRDREDRGERTGILRLRRDRGEDIWPDDGISDEDYWASVAADRPLTGTDTPLDNVPSPGGAKSRPGIDAPRPGAGGARPGPGAADSRFGGEQRAGERGATGRLGPPPGLAGDYKPGVPGSPGAMGSAGQPGGSGRTTGSGPIPARPGTGPTPTVGVTSSRPPAGRNGMRPGQAQPGTGPSRFPQPAARPSFQPNGHQSGGGPAGGRQQDRNDWGDRTERIDRIDASGYPDPRPGSRSQGTGSFGGPRASEPIGLGPSGAPGPSAANGRGRGDSGGWRAADRQPPDRREPDRREPDRRDNTREATDAWPASARAAAPARASTDDDPLTSKAYSRSAQSETDGRSYRAAARRSEAQARLTDQAETFIADPYQQPSQQQAGRTGEYRQYRDDAQAPAAQAQAGRYPAPGSQREHSAQPGRNQAGQGQGPGHAGQPGQPSRNSGRPGAGLPGTTGLPGTQYEAQQPRPSQPQHRQPGQSQLPAAGPSAGSAGSPTGSRPAGNGGLNPYDTTGTGSYPYPSQAYPARPTAPAQDSTDDRYYRPPAADGYSAGNASQGRSSQNGADQGRTTDYGNGYPAQGDRRY